MNPAESTTCRRPTASHVGPTTTISVSIREEIKIKNYTFSNYEETKKFEAETHKVLLGEGGEGEGTR